MVRQHAVSVTVGVCVWHSVPVVQVSRAVSLFQSSVALPGQCRPSSVSSCAVLVLAHVYESQPVEVLRIWRRYSQTASVSGAFLTLISHVEVPVEVPHG